MGRIDAESETLIPTGGFFDVAHSLRADGFDASEDGTGRGTPLVPVAHAFDARQSDVLQYGDKSGPLDTDGYTIAVAIRTAQTSANGHGVAVEVAHTLDQAQGQAVAIGLDEEQNATIDGMGCLKARREGGGFEGTVMTPAMAVRRLTPRECERLQGFPDDYTLIPYRGKPAADGPRYKALGNSMAVPVMQWIGRRIQQVDDI